MEVETMSKGTLEAFRNIQGEWMVAHSGPIAADVYEAFGTFILPAGWTPEATIEEVYQGLTEPNPDCKVIVRDNV